MRNAAGGYAWFLDRGVAVRDEKERVTRLVGALSDITERKLHEIELRRARDEAAEALERQTATAEVLRVISSSPSDLTLVYRAILEHIMRLCESHIGALFVRDGTLLSAAATLGMNPEMEQLLRQRSFRPGHSTPTRLAALERQVVQVPDLLADQAFAPTPRELYGEHLKEVMARADRALIAGGYDGLITCSGSQVYYYLDDSTYPFRPNPRYRFALDAATGNPLWDFQAGGACRANPISYLVDGRHVALAMGQALLVFALP